MTTAIAIALGAADFQRHIACAVEDLATAIDEYPHLSVFLGLARSGLVTALQRASEERDTRRRFFGLRGAAAIAAGTLEDVRKRHPELENESSLICDVAYALSDLAKMKPVGI